MQKVLDFLKQYHTYVVAAAAAACAIWQVATGTPVPAFVYELFGATGLISYRVTVSGIGAAGLGWKTILSALALGAVAGFRAGGIAVPPEVDALLASASLGSVTSAVNKI